MVDWFEELFGFCESSSTTDSCHDNVHQNMTVTGTVLHSQANGRAFEGGIFECLSLEELRKRGASLQSKSNKSNTGSNDTERTDSLAMSRPRLRIAELVGDARELHSRNAGATFQVASQFNLLEMVSPRITPEHGITRYEFDRTQGPACAIACAPGTVIRNYFVQVEDIIDPKQPITSSVAKHIVKERPFGQSRNHQIDCLSEVGKMLSNTNNRLWSMENGYALASRSGLKEINQTLSDYSEVELDQLRSQLKVGVQWDTQVTSNNDDLAQHLVTQVYGSALPVAYSQIREDLWEPFARFVLEASYEATFWTAILNSTRGKNSKTLYLTLLGGGAFGNNETWIFDAIERSCRLFQHYDLNVKLVSYRQSNRRIRKLCSRIEKSVREST